MKKKEELFFLIKSLTKSERRYFKLFSSSDTLDNNYKRLFEAISVQEKYDEDAIKEEFRGEVFIKQLTVTKNYLKNLILKSLRAYNTGISKEAIVRDVLRNTEILYQKGLYKMSLFEVSKAQAIAEKYDLFASHFEALAWKKRILQAENPQQVAELSEIAKEQFQLTSLLTVYTKIWSMNIQVEENLQEAVEISEDDPLQLLIFKHLYHFQQLIVKGNPIKAEKHLISILNAYEMQPKRKEEEAETYLVLLNNLLAMHVYQKNYNKAIPLIAEVKDFITGLRGYGAPVFKTFLRTLNIELEVYRESKDLIRGLSLIEEVNHLLRNSKLPIPESYKISFWFQFANLYFTARQYNESLKWVNILLDNRTNKARVDLITFAHWMNLMIHFELKNYFVLSYFVDSTRRFLRKRRKIEGYEEELLKLFAKISKVPTNELKPFFKTNYQRIESGEMVIPVSVLDYLDFKSWLKEKAN